MGLVALWLTYVCPLKLTSDVFRLPVAFSISRLFASIPLLRVSLDVELMHILWLADLTGSPHLIPSEYYYKIQVRPIF